MAADYLVLSRHGVYYFRRCVPTALRPTLGQRQVTISLHTSSRRVACVTAKACAAASDAFFSPASAMTTKKKDQNVTTTSLIMKYGLDENGNPWFNVDAEPDEIEAAKELMASAVLAMAAVQAAPFSSVAAGSAQAATAKARVTGPTLEAAPNAYGVALQVRPATARRYGPSLARLKAFLGAATPLASITQSQFADYAAKVKTNEGPRVKTKNMEITTGGTFFNWCGSHFDNLPAISTRQLKLKRMEPERNERAAFSIEDLQALVKAVAALRADEHHKYWITVMLIFTGMRVEELCQLNPHTDLKHDQVSAYWYFEIHEHDGNSVKTLAGWRQVPLHPALIDAGFLTYVATLKASGADKLFPLWLPRKDPTYGGLKYGHEAIRWSGRHLAKLRAAGVPITAKTSYLHSMRHVFVNNLKQAMVDENIRAALVGHEVGGINQNRYGKGYGIKLLGDALVENLPAYGTLLDKGGL